MKKSQPIDFLIIDNNTNELRKLRELLVKEGYSILTATSRSTARDLIGKIKIRYLLDKIEEDSESTVDPMNQGDDIC